MAVDPLAAQERRPSFLMTGLFRVQNPEYGPPFPPRFPGFDPARAGDGGHCPSCRGVWNVVWDFLRSFLRSGGGFEGFQNQGGLRHPGIMGIPIGAADPHREGLAFFQGGGDDDTTRRMAVPFFPGPKQVEVAFPGYDSLFDRQPDGDVGDGMQVERLQGRDLAAEFVGDPIFFAGAGLGFHYRSGLNGIPRNHQGQLRFPRSESG